MANKLTNLDITEVAFCKKGMNQHAKVALFKSCDDLKNTFVMLAKSEFSDALQGIKASRVFEGLWDQESALREAFQNIAQDDSIEDKDSAMRQAIGEFAESIKQVLEESVTNKQINKGQQPVFKKNGIRKTNQKEGSVARTKKNEDGLLKAAAEKIVKAYEAEELDTKTVEEHISDVVKGITESLTSKISDLEEKLEKAQDVGAVDRESFTDMDGTVIHKAEVGDTTYKLLKAQNTRMQKMADDLEHQKLAKAADELFPNIPGTSDEKADMLKAFGNLSEEVGKQCIDTLKKADVLFEKSFEENGHGEGATAEVKESPVMKILKSQYGNDNK